MSERKPAVTPKDNGPYLVKGLKKLNGSKGPLESNETIALCCCGASATKPFCDGSHARVGFSSARADDRLENKRDSYAGIRITVHDNRSVCAHAGYCTDKLASVFRMKQEPWIDADGATVDEIKAAVESCPSGALGYTVEGQEYSPAEDASSIFVVPGGPYVACGVEIEGVECGEGAIKDRVTLCRCGASKNKPFCDGSHWNTKFDEGD